MFSICFERKFVLEVIVVLLTFQPQIAWHENCWMLTWDSAEGAKGQGLGCYQFLWSLIPISMTPLTWMGDRCFPTIPFLSFTDENGVSMFGS